MNILRIGGLTFVSGLILLVAPGCKDNHSAAMPSPAVRSLARAEVRATPAPAPSTLHIYQPRPESEITNLFQPSRRPIVRPLAKVATTIPDDGIVTAEPAWGVPVTREWNHIVIHHSASTSGNAAIFDKAHRERGWEGLGYHFVIGNGNGSGDGEVEVGYRWTAQQAGAHAGVAEYNQHGIGICLVGNFDIDRPTSRQMASLRRLVRFLQVKTGVPTCEVIGHRNVKDTHCPGVNFDLEAFRASLGGGAIGVPIRYTSAPSKSSLIVSRSSAACP